MNTTIRLMAISGVMLVSSRACNNTEQNRQVEQEPMPVEIQKVESLSYLVPVKLSGLLATTTQMKLSFKTGGIIDQLKAREGMEVSEGEVLAVLDLSEIRARARQAEIGLDKSLRDMKRARNLYRDSVVTLEQYQNAESAYELARTQKQIADFNLQYSKIKAPSKGKIMKILVETNEVIAPGYPAIVFASTEDDWVVRAPVTDKDIVKLRIGDSAHVTMDAFPGKTFYAEVTELASGADPVTGTYESELKIFESDPQFRLGFFSRAMIFPAGRKHDLVVPMEALVNASDHRAHVFVFQGAPKQGSPKQGSPNQGSPDQGAPNQSDPSQGWVSKRVLNTGRILGDRVVVLDGLKEGEWIVTRGAKFLREEMEVKAVQQTEKIAP